MVHHSACSLLLLLLLLLTCLGGFSASVTEQAGTTKDTSYGPSSVNISGVDVVTVGISYGFHCSADCHPGCHFNWTWGNVTSEGPELTLKLPHVEPPQNLTCTAVNNVTGKSASVQKTLQVTAGPTNIKISGPLLLTAGVTSNFNCSADCYPPCSYSWTVVLNGEVSGTAQGSTISVTPPDFFVFFVTVTCKAQDTVSHLFISTTVDLLVASSDNNNLSTRPEETSAVLLLAVVFSAAFTL